MAKRWSRRSVLAGVGTVALAGCTTDTDDARADSTETATVTPPAYEPATTSARTESRTTQSESEPPTTPAESEPHTTSSGPVPEPSESLDSGWPVPEADAGRTNYASKSPGPTEQVTELWRFIADVAFSTPVVADETVFVGGGDGSVRALDARSGEERWQRSVGAAVGTPWAVGDHLFVPTAEVIVALERNDGTESWRVETPGRAALLVATHGVYWIAEGGPAVVALSRDDGGERWRTGIDDPWEPTLFASDESVFVSSGTHDSRFWTLSADNGDLPGKPPRHGNDFPAEQFYVDGTVYAVDAFFGNVHATAVEDDGYDWSQGVPYGGGEGGGLLSGGTDRVYYTSNGENESKLHALSKTDGTVAWSTDVATTIIGRPVVAEESVLVPTADGVRCFDTAGGDELWTRSDVSTRLVVVDDVLYASGNGMIRAFRAP